MDIKKNIKFSKIVLICSVLMFVFGILIVLYDGVSGNGFRPLYISLVVCFLLAIAQVITIIKLKNKLINNK